MIMDLRDGLSVAQMFTDVHAQGSGTSAESVSLRSEFTSVTNLTKELILVSVGVGRVQHLVAQTCHSISNVIKCLLGNLYFDKIKLTALEALLVPFQSTGHALFSSVDGLGTLGTLGDLSRGERHLETLQVVLYRTNW